MLFLVNHFPLFAILLRLKDPERLPSKHDKVVFQLADGLLGGIVLKCTATSGSVRVEVKLFFREIACIRDLTSIQNKPLSLAAIFSHYRSCFPFMLASYAKLIVYRGVPLFVVSQVSPTETPVSGVTRELIIGVELAVVQYTIHTNTDA